MSLPAYIARRLLVGAAVMFAVSILVFLSLHMAPGDPVDLLIPPDAAGHASAEQMDEIRTRLGLNDPLHEQYLRFVRQFVTFDFGRSLRSDQPIGPILANGYLRTIELTIAAALLSTTLGIFIGVISATRRDTWVDNIGRAIAFAGVSIPSFWLGLLMMIGISFHLGLLPISGRGGPMWTIEGIRHMVLPAITLSAGGIAILVRLVRSSMLDVLNEDYVRTARAKGLNERIVIYRHALKNAMIPVITMLGLQIGFFLSGSVVVETVFAWPGIGRLLINSIMGRDFPVVQAAVLCVAGTFVIVNIIVDVLYSVVDPRVRY